MRRMFLAQSRFRRAAAAIPAVAALGALVLQSPAGAGAPFQFPVLPGNLLVSTSTFGFDPNIVAGVTQLPNGCTPGNCATAIASGDYPYVFNNDAVDGSFGVTTKLILDQMTPSGIPLGSIEVPNSLEPGVGSTTDQMVTSFSSKSELELNLSPDGKYVSFMGYDAPVYTSDVSNDNTPGENVSGNADPGLNYRVVATLGRNGKFNLTLTNAFTGDNGRAAIFNDKSNVLYMAGNASGAKKAQPGVLLGAGAQITTPSTLPEAAQSPGTPTPVGTFNITELGDAADKAGKDDNFRGVGIYNNVLYYTKGSGSNGVNTLYYVNTSGTPCTNGVGLPQHGATLPTTPVTTSAVTGTALTPNNMCILQGLPTGLATNPTNYPFGFWFANPTTLYIADEGSGDNTYSTTETDYTNALPSAQPQAGLEKWVFDATTQSWDLAYTLQSGLNLGQPYSVPGYPTGINSATGLPWAPATDGLRNMTGRVNRDGTVTIWATSSTVSGGGDQGADPNKLVSITDKVGASTLPASESFQTVRPAVSGVRYGGVSFTPGTCTPSASHPCVPPLP
jgi:hypothetical protein